MPWRRTRDPYAVWISEVMLQQTQVKTVVPYYERFMSQFPDLAALAGVEEQAILKAWEGLGYYTRARNLHRAAKIVVQTMGGRLPAERVAFRALPGVGDYIAAAVLSIAFDQPFAVVDGNVKRVLARLFLLNAPVNNTSFHHQFQASADRLLEKRHPGHHNQAMMELGALVCTPRSPHCRHCPVVLCCGAKKADVIGQYPKREPRKATPLKRWAAGVVLKKGRLLLIQRPARGLLAGLWEFPGGEIFPGEDPEKACRQRILRHTGLLVADIGHVTLVRHAYTHFKLSMDLFLCHWKSGRVKLSGPAAFHWVRPDRLDRFPLHKAVHKALPKLLELLD
ncbi:MAG: A/G-specific adenine glycosylase [Desulfatitalea sp.]|nr:A/G-specific adenine glycosylase [Desulfatitalea sp.]